MSSTDTDPENAVETIQDPSEAKVDGAAEAAEPSAVAEAVEPPAVAGRPARAARLLVPIALAVLAIASAVALGLLGWQAIQNGNTERNGTAALDAARTRTPQVLSFDVKTLDADLARGRAQLSGTFADQFEQLTTTVVVPASKQNGVASRVEVTRAALIDSQADRAETLLFLSQTTTSSARPQPQQASIQVKVVMTKSASGEWLISEMHPL